MKQMRETTSSFEEKTKIMGVKVDLLSKKEVLKKVNSFLSNFENKSFSRDREDKSVEEENLICTTNSEFIMTAQKDPEFKSLINRSFLSVPDGVGVLCANYYLQNFSDKNLISKLFNGLIFGLTIPIKPLRESFAPDLGERVDGVSLVYDLAALAERKNYSIFLLGGWPTNFWGKPINNPEYDLAQRSGKKLKEIYPNLNIIGATSKFSHKKEEDESTLKYIKEQMDKSGVNKIDLLIVCYGHGNQEKWISRNAHRIPATLSMGAGGSFDYISGDKHWAPKWIQEIHLEWFYRLLTQPWRIKRVFRSFPVFPFKVFLYSLDR